jgi:hypothetical protein
MSEFPYGEILPLEGNMMCVTGGQLINIFSRRPYLRLKWMRRRWPYTTRKIGHREIVLKILPCKSAWWRVRLFYSFDGFCDLCFAFTNCTAIFPTLLSAGTAAEIFASGQNWEVAPLVWQDKTVTGCR